MPDLSDGPWLTRTETAKRLRVSTRTVDLWANAGKITRFKVEGLQSVRFRQAEVDGLLSPVPADGAD